MSIAVVSRHRQQHPAKRGSHVKNQLSVRPLRPRPTTSKGRRRYVRIPQCWSGQEALTVAGFLEQLIHAIWRAHGESMGPILAQGLTRPEHLKPWPCATLLDRGTYPDHHTDDDIIPF